MGTLRIVIAIFATFNLSIILQIWYAFSNPEKI